MSFIQSLSLSFTAIQASSTSSVARSGTGAAASTVEPAGASGRDAPQSPVGPRRHPLMAALMSALDSLRTGAIGDTATAAPASNSAAATTGAPTAAASGNTANPGDLRDAVMDFAHVMFQALRTLGDAAAPAGAASAVSPEDGGQDQHRHGHHHYGHPGAGHGHHGWGPGGVAGLADRLDSLAARLTAGPQADPSADAAASEVAASGSATPQAEPVVIAPPTAEGAESPAPAVTQAVQLQLSLTQARASVDVGGASADFTATVSTLSLQIQWGALGSAPSVSGGAADAQGVIEAEPSDVAVGATSVDGTPVGADAEAVGSTAEAQAPSDAQVTAAPDPFAELRAAFARLFEQLNPGQTAADGPQQLADFLRSVADGLRSGTAANEPAASATAAGSLLRLAA